MLTLEQETALANALTEVERNFDDALRAVFMNLWLDSDAKATAVQSLKGSEQAIALLQGPLLEAARGLRPWPLDTGTSINTAGALDAWIRLADSVKAATEGVKNFGGSWSALAWLKKVAAGTYQELKSGTQTALAGVGALLVLLIVLEVVRK